MLETRSVVHRRHHSQAETSQPDIWLQLDHLAQNITNVITVQTAPRLTDLCPPRDPPEEASTIRVGAMVVRREATEG
jgi:hypothetical protein